MRSIKLDVPKPPGEKQYNEGLAYGACGGFCRVGSSRGGSAQAAGKRHSQPFSAKRLPHPRGFVSQPSRCKDVNP